MDAGARLTAKGTKQRPPFLEAARFGKAVICRSLLARGVDWRVVDPADGRSVLELAAKGGHAEVCRLLIELGADVHEVNREGITALHYAAVGIPKKTLEVCRVLVEAGADSSTQPAPSPAGYLTPFQEAVRTRGRAEILTYLISACGEDAAQRTADGKTMFAIAGDAMIKEVLHAAKLEQSVARSLGSATGSATPPAPSRMFEPM
jgi:ankyrin repeat protein